VAERLSVAQDVEGSIPSSRPKRTDPQGVMNQLAETLSHVNPEPQQNKEPEFGDLVFPRGRLPLWLTPFEPRRGLSNGHLQTIVGNYLPRPPFRVDGIPDKIEVDPADGSRVLCHCHWQPERERASRLTLVLVHGLEGSSNSRYIQGIAARAFDAGFNVIRMNMRNCGGTDALTPTLYHSGLSDDLGAVVRHYAREFSLQRVALVGYSMGGNLVLKLAGEWGNQAPLVAVAAVCPAIDLALGADALHEPLNRAYEWNFLRGLRARYARKWELFPASYDPPSEIGEVRSIRQFDHKIVSRYCGFRDADDYYYRAASARVVDRIAVPTFILHALDDPFIRLLPATRAKLLANSHITFVETRHGGHCAYLSRDAGNEIHWAESTVIRFLQARDGQPHGS
jgi:predicted alpha/beta-fold hydrolase